MKKSIENKGKAATGVLKTSLQATQNIEIFDIFLKRRI
jgi:hypothetical protein